MADFDSPAVASDTGTSRTSCPRCHTPDATLGTRTDRFVYLRCRTCQEVWAIAERRGLARIKIDRTVPAAPPPGLEPV